MMADDDEEKLREIAKDIANFRKEFWEKVSGDIVNEIETMQRDGIDPAKGRGRGPWWADGA